MHLLCASNWAMHNDRENEQLQSIRSQRFWQNGMMKLTTCAQSLFTNAAKLTFLVLTAHPLLVFNKAISFKKPKTFLKNENGIICELSKFYSSKINFDNIS